MISQGVHPLCGVKQVRGGENKLFLRKMRQYHSPDGADGCCITSNKSFTCLQLVFTSNRSNFRHAFASHGFVSVSWAFLVINNKIKGNEREGKVHKVTRRYISPICGVDSPGPIPIKIVMVVAPHDVIKMSNFVIKFSGVSDLHGVKILFFSLTLLVIQQCSQGIVLKDISTKLVKVTFPPICLH